MGGEKTLNETLLRIVAERLGSLSIVDTVRVFPYEKPDAVVAEIVADYYPEDVRRVELECRVYTNGDFSITYREVRSSTDLMARWDRHANPHNNRDHYHEPPRARTDDAVDASYPDDVLEVVSVVLSDVDDRLGDVWDDTPAE